MPNITQALLTGFVAAVLSTLGVLLAQSRQDRRDARNDLRTLRDAKSRRVRAACHAMLSVAATWQDISNRQAMMTAPSGTPKTQDPALRTLFDQSLADAIKSEAAIVLEEDTDDIRDAFYRAKFAYVSYFFNAEMAGQIAGPSPARTAADPRGVSAEIEALATECRKLLQRIEQPVWQPRRLRIPFRRKQLRFSPPAADPIARQFRTGAFSEGPQPLDRQHKP